MRRTQPDQPQRHAMPLHRQTEPPRGGEIERAGIAGDLSDHESQIAATQPFFQREQRVLGRLCGNVDQPVAQRCRQARLIRPPAQPDRPSILDPQPAAIALRAAPIERQGQRQRRPAAFARRSKYLAMQGPLAQSRPPARQGCTCRLMARDTGPREGGKRGNHSHRESPLFYLCSHS